MFNSSPISSAEREETMAPWVRDDLDEAFASSGRSAFAIGMRLT